MPTLSNFGLISEKNTKKCLTQQSTPFSLFTNFEIIINFFREKERVQTKAIQNQEQQQTVAMGFGVGARSKTQLK